MIQKFGGFFRQFRKNSSEYEQALLRVVFAVLIFTFLLFHRLSHTNADASSDIELDVLMFSAGFLAFSIVFLAVVLASQKLSKRRQLLAIVADMGAVTFGMLMTEETGALFYGIYLWVIVGNGLRYGTQSLLKSHVIGVAGFILVILNNNYWQTHSTLAVALLLTLILIPLYIYTLLERLKQAVTHAEEASKAKSYFLANMSHEMRTPLNGVIGISDLILATPLSAEQKDLVNTLRNSGRILLKLIENVLDLSKIESGKLIAEVVDFDLHSMISKTLDMFASQAKEKGLKLHAHFSPETCFQLRGDMQHLRQVIINLVGNAIKFTKVGSVELRVTTHVQDEMKAHLRFEVIDTGIGIPPESQQIIFESFTQANASITSTYGGTGLGTTISKQLVQFMGGQIGLQSEGGKGSIFWFELPFEKQPKNQMLDELLTLGQMRVLGVGMPEIEQGIIADYLSCWGTQFDHAASLAQLFTLLGEITSGQQQNIVVLCSPHTLGMNAEEFAAQMWAGCSPRKVSAILVEHNPNEIDEETLFSLGYCCLLKSPIDKTLLFNALHSVLSMQAQADDDVVSFLEHYERNSLKKRRLNILVAEDNGTNRMILSKILEYAGHSTDLVENGEQALDMLEAKRYDLAIIDMQMPVMTGLDAIKIYRMTVRKDTGMPIAILTANATIEARRECEEAGADAFLTKPIDVSALLDTVVRLTATQPADAPKPASHNAIPVINGDALLLNENTLFQLRLLGGGDDYFVNTVIQGFIAEGEQLLESMKAALLKREYNTFKELAHTLKGSTGNLGAEALFQICREILQLNQSDLQASAEELLRKAQDSFSATRQAMTNYLETVKLSCKPHIKQ